MSISWRYRNNLRQGASEVRYQALTLGWKLFSWKGATPTLFLPARLWRDKQESLPWLTFEEEFLDTVKWERWKNIRDTKQRLGKDRAGEPKSTRCALWWLTQNSTQCPPSPAFPAVWPVGKRKGHRVIARWEGDTGKLLLSLSTWSKGPDPQYWG